MPSLHLPRLHQRHPSVDSRMHYATKALYTVDGALKDDSELQIIHDSIVTADLSDEEDVQRFNQELYRTALKEANKNTYYQQRANNDASVAIRTQLNEQRLRKQLHSLQSEWAQQANNNRRTEHHQLQHMPSIESTSTTTLSASNSRKTRRRHNHGQDFVVLKGQDLARLQSISTRDPTGSRKNEYYSFHDDYMMERERERQRREEEERNKNRWVIDDMDVVQPYDDYKFVNSSNEQLPQQLLQHPIQQQQPQLYQQIPTEQFSLPIPPPALSNSPVSFRSDQSLFYTSNSNNNSTHSLSMPPPLTSYEDTSSSSSGGSSSPDTDHHSDAGFLFTDQYVNCKEEGESVLPLETTKQTHTAESKLTLNPLNQHIPVSTAATKPEDSPATKDLTTNNDGGVSSSLPKNNASDTSSISGLVESQPSVDHPNLPPYFPKTSDTIVTSLEKQASTILKPSPFSSSSPSLSSSSLPLSSSSFVSVHDETSTIKPHSHRQGNYPPSKMSSDSKVSTFSAKGIYDRLSKKKSSTPRVQSSLANSQASHRQPAPSLKAHAMPHPTPSYREPYARSTTSTVTPRSRQPQPLTNYPQSVYTVGTDTRSLNSYKSRKGELQVPIPLNNGVGYARSHRTVKAVPVETPRPEPQNRFAAAAAAATAAPAPVSSQQQAVEYGEQFYDAWQSTKQMFEEWATARVSLIVLAIYILLHFF